MKDFSSYGYMQGPIKAMVQEDLTKMGVLLLQNKRRLSKHQLVISTGSVHDKTIYGKPLHELETRPVPGQPFLRVPRLLLRSCNFLLHHINTEGLFRKSGSVSRQKTIKVTLNEGHSIPEDSNPHDVASLLKQFLRELPDPLITYELYDAFIQTQLLELEEDKIQSMLLLCLFLPDMNRHTLQFLVRFLQTVAEGNMANKMSISNLAVVMAPNIIRSTSPDPQKIKVETALMECFLQNASEVGLVPDYLVDRAHKMVLELSGMWGVSKQEAAYKLPLKGKRKRSGSLSGIITSVFKNNKNVIRTVKRKSVSNQDLSVDNGKSKSSISKDLSSSTPCIIKTPGTSTKSVVNTPLLTAQRRAVLLRQTPVDPRRKPQNNKSSTSHVDYEVDSPIEMDPPKKRSKMDELTPEPIKKRKNFKQRLSEGLSSRYRKSRLKRKSRASRGSTISEKHQQPPPPQPPPPQPSDRYSSSSDPKKRDRTPVFCFKGNPGSFNQQERKVSVSSSKEVVVNQCTRFIDSPVQPELLEFPKESITDTPGLWNKKSSGKKLFPSPQPESSDDEVEINLDSIPSNKNIAQKNTSKCNESYIQSQSDVIMPQDAASKHQKEGRRSQSSQFLFKSNRASLPLTGNKNVGKHRLSLPLNFADTTTPLGLRRSPRLLERNKSELMRNLTMEFSENQRVHSARSLSGSSYTAAKKHSVQLGKQVDDDTTAQRDAAAVAQDPGNDSLNNSLNLMALITPQTFSRTRSRSSELNNVVSMASFSPIKMSLENITPAVEEIKRVRKSPRLNAPSGDDSNPPEPHEGSSPLNSREGTATYANITDLFTSRDVTNIDVSLNVSEFDKRFRDIAVELNRDQDRHVPEGGETAKSRPSTQQLDFISAYSTTKNNQTLDLSSTFITNQSEHEDFSRVTYITHNITDISERDGTINNSNSNLSDRSDRVDYPKIETLPRMLLFNKLPETLSTSDLMLSPSRNSSEDVSEPKPPPRRSPRLRQCSDPLIRPKKLNSSSDLESMSNVLDVSEMKSTDSSSSLLIGSLQPAQSLSSPLETSDLIKTPPKTTLPEGIRHLGIENRLTPLNLPLKSKTISKEAVVVSDTRVKPDLSVVIQDDQVSSSTQLHENKENVKTPKNCNTVTANTATTPTVTPLQEGGAASRMQQITPKSGTDNSAAANNNEINITPRTKISKGFTKNLASQWESRNRVDMGSCHVTSSTRATRTATKTAIRPPLSFSERKATLRKPANGGAPSKSRAAVLQSQDSMKAVPPSRKVKPKTPARATSARVPGSSSRISRPVSRVKSDNVKPAWRF